MVSVRGGRCGRVVWAVLAVALSGSCADESNSPSILAAMLEENPANHLSTIVRFDTTRLATPSVEVRGPAGTWRVPTTGVLTDAPAMTHRVAVVGLRAGSSYDLVPLAVAEHGSTASAAALRYTPAPNPQDFPPIVVGKRLSHEMQPGLTLFAVNRGWIFGQGTVYGVDDEGEIVWYHREPEGTVNHVMRLRNGNFLTMGAVVREIDLLGQEVRRFTAEQLGVDLLHHAVVELPNGNLLALSAELRVIDGYAGGESFNVVGDTILEFTRDGVVVDEISLFDVLDPHRIPVQASFDSPMFNLLYGVATKDWTHSNGLVHDASDDSVIVSVRHQNIVVKLSRATGRLVWVIGRDHAATSGDDAWPFLELVGGGSLPSHQHAPALLPDGHIMVYDNGNERQPLVSRAVEYALDVHAGTMRQVGEWIDPDYDPPLFATFAGDADPQPSGTVLVADVGLVNGSILFGHRWMHLAEFRRSDGEQVWDLVIRDDVGGISYSGYDAMRIASLYPPIDAAMRSR